MLEAKIIKRNKDFISEVIDEVFVYTEVIFMIKREREMPIDLYNRGYPWRFYKNRRILRLI